MSYFDMLKETWFSPKIMPSVCPNLQIWFQHTHPRKYSPCKNLIKY